MFVLSEGTCTHTGFLPESDPASVVEFFTSTGIAAAGGQFDFERCVVFDFERCVVFDFERCVVFDFERCVVF